MEQIEAPSLFIYSDDDQVVDPKYTEAVYAKWGSEVKEVIKVAGVTGENNHVITGDIVAPQSTAKSIKQVVGFLEELGVTGTEGEETVSLAVANSAI